MKLICLVAALMCANPNTEQQTPNTEFELPDTQGKTVRLSDLRGKPVILNFWAFWCDTWKDEMPHLRELAPMQKERGFQLIAISVDGTRVEQFKKPEPKGVPFQVLLDNGKKVSESYQIRHVPTIIILDKDGKERYRHIGFPGNHVILRELRKLNQT